MHASYHYFTDSGSSLSLRYLSQRIMSNKRCARYFGEFVRDYNICGDGEGNLGTCNVSYHSYEVASSLVTETLHSLMSVLFWQAYWNLKLLAERLVKPITPREGKKVVCLLVTTITQKRVEIQPRAFEPDSLSWKARQLLKFRPLALFLRVVVMKPEGMILH